MKSTTAPQTESTSVVKQDNINEISPALKIKDTMTIIYTISVWYVLHTMIR